MRKTEGARGDARSFDHANPDGGGRDGKLRTCGAIGRTIGIGGQPRSASRVVARESGDLPLRRHVRWRRSHCTNLEIPGRFLADSWQILGLAALGDLFANFSVGHRMAVEIPSTVDGVDDVDEDAIPGLLAA
jgi:hypothetical protein